MRIGLDFDNTIVCYDALFHSIGVERCLITRETTPSKRAVRDLVRRLPDGEYHWQRLQAEVYGPRVADATPFPGLIEFLLAGSACGVNFFIVSHKGQFAALDTGCHHNLVAAANDWLNVHKIVSASGPIRAGDIYFEPSRRDKISRIARLACDVFVDDLEETFVEPGFPTTTRALLFDPCAPAIMRQTEPRVAVCRSWSEVAAKLLVNVT